MKQLTIQHSKLFLCNLITISNPSHAAVRISKGRRFLWPICTFLCLALSALQSRRIYRESRNYEFYITISFLPITEVEVFIQSKVQCVYCFENCSTEGRGGEKGGSANSKTKHIEPLTSELISPLYTILSLVHAQACYGSIQVRVLLMSSHSAFWRQEAKVLITGSVGAVALFVCPAWPLSSLVFCAGFPRLPMPT